MRVRDLGGAAGPWGWGAGVCVCVCFRPWWGAKGATAEMCACCTDLERSLCALVERLLLGVLDDSRVGAEEDGVVGGAADDPDREVRRLVELTHCAVPGGK